MFHLPESAFNLSNVLLYHANSPAAGQAWHSWIKPPGLTHLGIVAISGGGGGGAYQGVSPFAGGGGGGSSGISRYIYPMWAVPDRLLISVGFGGSGGGSINAAGSAGILSYVSVHPNTAANNLYAVSGAAAPAGGTANPTSGGAAGTIATNAGAVFSCWALGVDYIAGVAGTSGGASSNGADLAPGTGCQIMSGTGGGSSPGSAVRGGNISSVSNTRIITNPGGIGSGANHAANAGSNGFRHDVLAFIYGGTGAGCGGTFAGDGANGNSYGAGGGGGSAALGGDGGVGGRGGPGLVIMISW